MLSGNYLVNNRGNWKYPHFIILEVHVLLMSGRERPQMVGMVMGEEGGGEGEGGTLLGLPELDTDVDVSWLVKVGSSSVVTCLG